MPKKWERDAQRKRHNEHLQRIRDMQPTVDDKAPKERPRDNRKQIERDRVLAVVERDNRLLLDRLGKAMEAKNIDNFIAPVKFTSVQEENRKKELRRVTADNLRLLNRIQNVEPMYRALEWERDAELRDRYLATMTEFPEYFVPKYSPSKQLQQAQNVARDAMTPKSPSRTPLQPANTPASQPFSPQQGGYFGSGMGPFSAAVASAAASNSPYILPPEGDPLRNGLQRPYTLQNLSY
jgi:hypothetical protein